jgi:pSer/pThr/pTyr-binding forkhead associated (FHA) protein
VERSGTVIETEEEIRQAILSGLKGQQRAVPLDRPAAPQPQPAPAHAAAVVPPQAVGPFRPTFRPPVALLTVFDDGKNDGEVIRIRVERFVIGRTEGDLKIPIDGRISARHVEITLQTIGGMHRWVVTDLQSTHGMFVRVSRTVLNDRAEFLVGNGRYRFETPQGLAEATVDVGAEPGDFGQTRGWADSPVALRAPAVTELIGNEIGNRMLLVKPEYWIGSDPTCAICRPDDPFCEPRHVRLYRGPHGGWHAEHNKTLNGLWIKMAQIVVDATVRFQIGEQRFQIKV